MHGTRNFKNANKNVMKEMLIPRLCVVCERNYNFEYPLICSNLCCPPHCNMCPIRSFAINPRKAQSASGLSKRSRINRSPDVLEHLKAWIRIWYQQFQDTGSILHVRTAGNPYVSDENFDLIHEVFFRTPRKSARAVNCLSDFISTAHSILRHLRIKSD
jgi:hypothetical protein